MQLEQSFEVSAPLERVWDALVDVERVAPCLPGAAVTGRNDDGSYNGEFKVKIGPTSAAYAGKLEMESVDAEGHRATMQAAGTDRRGQGGAKATISSSVEPIDAAQTKVNVMTDYHITGRLARFGRGGMIEEISNRLLTEFAANLQRMLAAGETGEGAAVEADAAGSAGDDAAAAKGAAPAVSEPAIDEPVAGLPGSDHEAAAERAGGPSTASADEPPAAAAGSKGEPDAPGHAREATAETGPDGSPPPQSPPTRPPETEPVDGLKLIGGAVAAQARDHPVAVAGVLAGILVALGLIRRRGRAGR